MATIYTIGHSTRSLDQFLAALRGHGITTLVDIRAFPMSRRLPHFNREALEQELSRCGIAYVWLKELGGRRKKMRDDSPNTALRDPSFRNYADYMMTEEFGEAIARLLTVADEADGPTHSPKNGDEGGAPENPGPPTPPGMTSQERSGNRVAILCAERMWFQCHRMLVSDYLTAHGHTVLHIDDEKRAPRPHTLMAEARLVQGKLVYNAGELF